MSLENSLIKHDIPRDDSCHTGRTIEGYTVCDKLGEGAFGVVYVGEKDGKKYALKFLKCKDPKLARALKDEAGRMAALEHPNLLKFHEFYDNAKFRDNGAEPEHMLVTEYDEGMSALDVSKIAYYDLPYIMLQIIDAIEALHDANMLHRDIKPENILVTKSGYVKIGDYGLSKIIDEHANFRNTMLSATATIIGDQGFAGTFGYLPDDKNEVMNPDQRLDIHSMGKVFYQMILGDKSKFPDPTAHSKLMNAAYTKKLNSPSELTAFIIKCVLQDKEERYQSIKELKNSKNYEKLLESVMTFKEPDSNLWTNIVEAVCRNYKKGPLTTIKNLKLRSMEESERAAAAKEISKENYSQLVKIVMAGKSELIKSTKDAVLAVDMVNLFLKDMFERDVNAEFEESFEDVFSFLNGLKEKYDLDLDTTQKIIQPYMKKIEIMYEKNRKLEEEARAEYERQQEKIEEANKQKALQVYREKGLEGLVSPPENLEEEPVEEVKPGLLGRILSAMTFLRKKKPEPKPRPREPYKIKMYHDESIEVIGEEYAAFAKIANIIKVDDLKTEKDGHMLINILRKNINDLDEYTFWDYSQTCNMLDKIVAVGEKFGIDVSRVMERLNYLIVDGRLFYKSISKHADSSLDWFNDHMDEVEKHGKNYNFDVKNLFILYALKKASCVVKDANNEQGEDALKKTKLGLEMIRVLDKRCGYGFYDRIMEVESGKSIEPPLDPKIRSEFGTPEESETIKEFINSLSEFYKKQGMDFHKVLNEVFEVKNEELPQTQVVKDKLNEPEPASQTQTESTKHAEEVVDEEDYEEPEYE